VFVPMEIPLLEYVNGKALRAHLAGQSMFANSIGGEMEECPPSAVSAEEYRAQALTSTVLHAASSDLRPGIADDIRGEFPAEGRTSGDARTVEVEREFETPSRWPPKAGTTPFHCGRKSRTLAGRPVAIEASARSSIRARERPSARKLSPINLFGF